MSQVFQLQAALRGDPIVRHNRPVRPIAGDGFWPEVEQTQFLDDAPIDLEKTPGRVLGEVAAVLVSVLTLVVALNLVSWT